MRLYLVIIGGLALCAGPLFAQDYIDLEAERVQQQKAAEAANAGSTAGPDGEAGDDSAADAMAEPAVEPVTTSQGSVSGALYYKLQLLEQEVRELRGQMEEQAYELRQLKQQSLERYVDIDRRLSTATTAAPAGNQSAGGNVTIGATVPEQPGEADAYRSAYSLVRSQQFNEAVTSFRQFLQDFPAGKYAPNAHYWLGELFLVIVPPDLESSRREFTLLLEQYPDNSKIPDALYKLGKVYFDKGNPEKAREYLDRVVKEYGDSGSSAVKLARDFISQNY